MTFLLTRSKVFFDQILPNLLWKIISISFPFLTNIWGDFFAQAVLLEMCRSAFWYFNQLLSSWKIPVFLYFVKKNLFLTNSLRKLFKARATKIVKSLTDYSHTRAEIARDNAPTYKSLEKTCNKIASTNRTRQHAKCWVDILTSI